jgi:UDP-glucose 4-epimerase
MDDRDVVVTGGAGFIGSHLVDALVADNTVTVIDDLSAGNEDFVHDDAIFELVDIGEYDALREAIGEPDVIFHMAADARTRENAMGWDDPVYNAGVNARGTLNLLRAVDALDIDPTIVYASSAAVYGDAQYTPMDEDHPTDPVSPYGIHKLAGEKYMQAYATEIGLDTRSVRIFNTFGPRQPRYVMYDFLKKLQQDPSTLEVLGTGQQVRDYAYIDDTVRGFQTIATNGDPGAVYNISGQNTISISDLAELMTDLLDLEAEITYTQETWTGDIDRIAADISKLQDLGFAPQVDLTTGLQRFIDYFEEREGPIT